MTKTVKVKIGLVVCSDGEWLTGEATRSTGSVDWDAIEHYLEPHTEQKRHIIHVEVPLPEVTEINAKAEAVE